MTGDDCLALLSEAFSHFRRWDFAAYGNAVTEARAGVSALGDPPELLGEWVLISSFTAFGEAGRQADILARACSMLGGRSRVVPFGTPMLLDCGDPFATFWRRPGEADGVAGDIARTETLWSRLTGGGGGTTALYLARLAYCRGELGQALELAGEARRQAEEGGQRMNLLLAAELQGLLKRHRAQAGGDALAVCRQCEGSGDRALSQLAQIVRSNLYLSIGIVSETPSWLQTGDFGAVSHPDSPGWKIVGDKLAAPLLPSAMLMRMQYLSYTGQYIEALALADSMQLIFRVRVLLIDLYLDFWRAGCYYGLGDMQRYRDCLASVLERCAPDGLWLIPGEYEAGGELLAGLASRYGDDAVRRVKQVGAGLLGRNERLREAYLREKMPEALTRREREVLELVNRGATNAQAALELGVGEETVKTHLKHVFDKLGVSSRTQLFDAMGRARTASTPVWSMEKK